MSKVWSAMIGKNIRVYLADTTEMVQDAASIHKTSTVSSIALGRALTATSLLGKLLKNEKDVLTLKVAGTNQIKTILATTNFQGNVKGYISNADAELPIQETFESIGEAIGKGGSITVIRDFGLKEPYVGISHMMNAEIDDDIAFYFRNSEQQPTAMKLKVDAEGQQVNSAYGILIQTLPDIDETEKSMYNEAKNGLKGIDRMRNTEEVRTKLQGLFPALDVQVTGEFDIAFKCDCSRERISKALLTVGKEELKEILAVDQQAELKCHFCETNYHFTKEDLEQMIRAISENNHSE